MNVLVTGANGFIGRHIVRKLDTAGLHVIAAYRSINDYNRRLSSRVETYELDLSDNVQLTVLPSKVDVIVHTAATRSAAGITTSNMILDNIYATRNLISYALRIGVRCFIYCSSISIHGAIEQHVINEKTPVINPDAYGLSKLMCEYLLMEASEIMPSVALRLPGVIGPGSHSNWLSQLIEQIRQNSPLLIYNPEQLFNNAVHVEDLAAFILRLLDISWEGFHAMPLAAAGMTTVRGAVDSLIKKTGSNSTYSFIPEKKKSFTMI